MNAFEKLQRWYQGQLPTALKNSFQHQSHPLEEPAALPAALPDGFSRLRHQKDHYIHQGFSQTFSEASWMELTEKSRLITGEEVEAIPFPLREELLESMMLSAALTSGDQEVMKCMAEHLSAKDFTRPLLRQLYRRMEPSVRRDLLRKKCSEKRVQALSEEDLRLLLEIWAEHPMETLTASRLEGLVERCLESEKGLRALLQCAGNNRHNACRMADLLKDTDFSVASPRLQQAMMDYCVRQANPRTYCLLQDWEQELAARTSVEAWIPEYLQLSVAACRRRLAKRGELEPFGSETRSGEREGFILAQFMFYGDLMLPGKGNSGGIATLLRTMGDTLCQWPSVDRVFTFMMMPCDERAADSPLVTPLAPGHTLVRVPVFYNEVCSPELFREKEYEILHSLEQIMELLSIEPDLYHMRYSDNASLAAAHLARRKNRPGIFTLTPDPHRSIRTIDEQPGVSRGAATRQGNEEILLLMNQLNKVRAGDDILQSCKGILGIGTGEMKRPLFAYYPQLKERDARNQPLFRMIPEGISLGEKEEEPLPEAADPAVVFYNKGERYFLSPHRRQLPVMMTVGRLDPVKGQLLLLEAWSDPSLSENYNLVIIGGDLQRPDDREKQLLEAIDAYMKTNRRLQGGFCHLSRMDNRRLRQLQRALGEEPPRWPPHVYVAASQKEEFGLSIIEAMAAGLPAFAPKAGGVGSYVTPGDNGFLMNTETSDAIRDALITHLIREKRSAAEWAAIGKRGKATVTSRFDIRVISGDFVRFYQEVLDRNRERG